MGTNFRPNGFTRSGFRGFYPNIRMGGRVRGDIRIGWFKILDLKLYKGIIFALIERQNGGKHILPYQFIAEQYPDAPKLDKGYIQNLKSKNF